MVELKPHQREAVDKLSNGKILYGGTGTGKTFAAIAYYKEKESPKDVYVITTARKRNDGDWIVEFQDYGIWDVSPTVDSWNMIGKYEGVEGAFFIFDEQRLVGSGAWVKSFLKIAKHNNWIMLSATPGDTWLDYIPVFVANGFYKNRSEFKRDHVVYSYHSKFPKVERYLGVGKLVRLRNQLLVHMPYERHTSRQVTEIKVDYDKELFRRVLKDRWHVYENRPLRDVAELFVVMRKVVNSHASRIQTLESLMEQHSRLIVFYNFDYELEALRQFLTPKQWSGTELSTSRSKSSSLKSNTNSSETRVPVTASTSPSDFASLIPTGTSSRSSAKKRTSTQSTKRSTTTITSSLSETCADTSERKTCRPSSGRWSDQPKTCETSTMKISTSTKFDSSDLSLRSTNRDSTISVAEWNGHKHEPIPTTDRWVYLVQYQAGSEAWNCVETNVMVMYSLTYSYRMWDQAFGRIDRLNTPYNELLYYILISDSVIDRGIKGSLDNKKSFNEGAFVQNVPIGS